MNIANQAGIKILPFAISSYKIDLNRWDNGTVIVSALPPVSVDNLDRKGLKMATRQLRESISASIAEMDRENGFKRDVSDEPESIAAEKENEAESSENK